MKLSVGDISINWSNYAPEMSQETAMGPTEKGLNEAFIWFHATSANGGAMAI